MWVCWCVLFVLASDGFVLLSVDAVVRWISYFFLRIFIHANLYAYLQSSGAMFSGKVAQFALNVGYEDIGVLFQHLISRIAFGAKADILPLCEIPFVQVVRARKLHRQGYKTVEDIAGDERQRESRIDSK